MKSCPPGLFSSCQIFSPKRFKLFRSKTFCISKRKQVSLQSESHGDQKQSWKFWSDCLSGVSLLLSLSLMTIGVSRTPSAAASDKRLMAVILHAPLTPSENTAAFMAAGKGAKHNGASPGNRLGLLENTLKQSTMQKNTPPFLLKLFWSKPGGGGGVTQGERDTRASTNK